MPVAVAVSFIVVKRGLQALAFHCSVNFPYSKFFVYVYDISDNSLYLPSIQMDCFIGNEVTAGQRMEWRTLS